MEPGEVNVWELAGLHASRRLLCTSARTLLFYAASPGTANVRLGACSSVNRSASVTATGPLADDGKHPTASYTVTALDLAMLSGPEREMFWERFYPSKQAALVATLYPADRGATNV